MYVYAEHFAALGLDAFIFFPLNCKAQPLERGSVNMQDDEFTFTPQFSSSAQMSPPSKETSPLRLSSAPKSAARASRDDFRHLATNVSPNPNEFSFTSGNSMASKPHNLSGFIPIDEVNPPSPVKYDSHGEFQFHSNGHVRQESDFSFNDNDSVNFNSSPTQRLNIGHLESKNLDLSDLNHTMSSALNTSVQTQLLLENNLSPRNALLDAENTDRADADNGEEDTDAFDTTVASSNLATDISSLNINSSNRIQSIASSVYSELPRPTSKKPTSSLILNPIPESLNIPTSRRDQVTQSTTSSIYSELPSPYYKTRFSSAKNPSGSKLGIIDEDRSPTSSKPRVSIRNQSLYQEYYNSETGELNLKHQHNLEEHSKSAINLDLSHDSSVDDTFNTSGDEEYTDDDDASALFVTSLYEFASDSLQSTNDSSICLSFDENEVAFTYKLDDSGWGEVTLLSTLKRGWVPMNYFKSTVAEDVKPESLKPLELAKSRWPLKLLLKHAGTFLLNPHCKPVSINGEIKGYTFDVESFNGMTDGVRKLLMDTDCISRSSLIVQKKPIVRKMRKKLLRGWSELVAKAKDYMGTVDQAKIEYLQLLTFQVLQKSVVFLDIWGIEKGEIGVSTDQLMNDTSFDTRQSIDDSAVTENETVHVDINYLERPPFVDYRINEIYNQLISYLALISGRIDLIEHNAQSFSILGVVVSQINLLVNEYMFIIKYIKALTPESLNKLKNLTSQINILDSTGEKIKTLIDDLNSYVSSLHTISKREDFSARVNPRSQGTIKRKNFNPNTYFYSREGSAIVVSACKMIELSSICYRILKNMIVNMEDFQLPNNRKYPNYIRMAVTPSEFIQKGTAGLLKNQAVKRQINNFQRASTLNPANAQSKVSKRFSMFKTGNSDQIKISNDGLDFLSNVNTDDSSPFIAQNGQFDTNLPDLDYNPNDEIMISTDGQMIGVSFKSLIFLLTDEKNPPDYFLTSTFFLTFRLFASNSMLMESLIERFDVDDENKRTNRVNDLHMRNRRQLVAKTFQIWMESYWKSSADYIMLAPLINFFNESLKNHLPVEGYRLLVIASKLIGNPPMEHYRDPQSNLLVDDDRQLLPRKLAPKSQKKHVSRMSMMIGANGNALAKEIDTYNSFLEDIETYGLEKIDDGETFDFRSSKTYNLNLELKNSDSLSTLVTPKQMSVISTIVLSYRKMLGSHWIKSNGLGTSPVDTKTLINLWWGTSQETWKIKNDDLSLLNFNGLEIAKQLTLIENKMFCSIKTSELLNQNFTTKKLHLNLSPNIQKSILFTNLLSDYVIESILRPNIEMSQRINVFKSWLKIAISCLYLRNFNSLTSIVTSLQSFLISRVTAIWNGVPVKYKELFEYLTSIIHPNKNYTAYREKLKEFVLSNLQNNLDIPTVPYLSLFLQDLTFVVDGNPDYRTNPKSFLDQKLINIDKYFKITKIIGDIQTLQVPYKDTGELGAFYNENNSDLMRSETLKSLKAQAQWSGNDDLALNDMFDIKGLPLLQELILLEIWKVKQTNDRDDDRSWKLSCELQPKEAE